MDIVIRWSSTRDHIKIIMRPLKTPIDIEGDTVRIQQIITNILTNAAQAMNETGEIEVTIEARGKQVAVQIQDQGRVFPKASTHLFSNVFTEVNRRNMRYEASVLAYH